MRIALLVPSRERIGKKKSLAKSVAETIDNPDNVRLYYGVDMDDPTRDKAYEIAEEHSFVEIVDIPAGPFQGLGRLWNICANETEEEIIAMIGDDMIFMTPKWDVEVLKEFTAPQIPEDGFKMLYCYDGRHGKRMAVNAFINRTYTDLTGYFMREEFMCDFIDLWLHQVYASLGRLKYRGDIHIEHQHWSFGKSAQDGVVQRIRGGSNVSKSRNLWVQTFEDRKKEAQMIADHLGIELDLSKINARITG